MLYEGRIEAAAAEHAAVDTLIEKNPGKPVSVTRRDPGETGPLVVHVGDDVYHVDEEGHYRKQAD